MELGYSNDSYFFKIECLDLRGLQTTNDFINQDIVSFSITEEMGRIVNGSLTLRDVGHAYSAMFRQGMRFNISWGYKKWNINLADVSADSANQLIAGSKRKGVQCVVSSISGQANESGEILLNIGFYGQEFMSAKQHKVFTSGTYKDVIAQAFFDLGITNQLIGFDLENTPLDTVTGIRQWEGSFNFLLRLSREWHCLFTIGYKPDGTKSGVFVSSNRMAGSEVQAYLLSIISIAGSTKNFYYNSGQFSNVKSYNWQMNTGESGQGDNVQIQMVNNTLQFKRYKAETGKVVTYQLNAARVKQQLDQSNDKMKTAFSANFLGAQDFDQVQWAFDAVEETTAPDGVGITVNLSLIGDPLITPSMQANFKSNFPGPLNQNKTPGTPIIYWIRKVTSNLSKSGYTCEVEVVDGFTLTGTYIQDTGIRQ